MLGGSFVLPLELTEVAFENLMKEVAWNIEVRWPSYDSYLATPDTDTDTTPPVYPPRLLATNS